MLLWLFLGACTCHILASMAYSKLSFGYDVVLGILGVGATLTAAKEFPHKHVRNETGQSGTLHQKAIVTQSEMIEHAFYQGLNLIQAIYLHTAYQCQPKDPAYGTEFRLLLLFLVTSPWFFRQKLPVHSFSDNWRRVYADERDKEREVGYDTEIRLYKIKKWQYVFYKHMVLHGINLLVAVSPTLPTSAQQHPLPYSLSWRIFWLLLNTSYVMEFFLQSLVKRRTILRQSTMLVLQRWLMACASAGAAVVLVQLSRRPPWGAEQQAPPFLLLPLLSLASLTLNFTNRHHDVLNTMSIAGVAVAVLRHSTGPGTGQP